MPSQGKTAEDPTKGPLQAFASRWVEGMRGRGSPEAQAMRAAKERDRLAKARTARDLDVEKRRHIEKMKERRK